MITDRRQRRANIVAWCAIALVSALFMVEARGGLAGRGSEKLKAHAAVSAQQAVMTSMVNGIQSPLFRQVSGPQLSGMRGQVTALASDDDPGSELATAALLTRLGDRDGALEQLAGLRNRIDSGEVEADAEFMRTFDGVRSLVDAAGAPGTRALDDEAIADVTKALGPTGRTLVAQATGDQDELDRLAGAGAIVLTVLVVAVVLGGLFALGGVAALVTFTVLAAMGRTAGIGRQDSQWSHVYAEMFAVWLGGYMLFARVPRAVFAWWREHGHAAPSMDLQLVVSVAATVVAAAVALWWGTRRGLPLRSIMAGVGLRAFTFRDVLWGVVCWSMGVALLLVGLVIAMILSSLFSDGRMHATHPIQQMVEDSGTLGLFLTYALACASAPLFEELFFRGAMYRNLRQGLGRWGSLGGAVLSVAISSFIFAAIHPQGLVFVPVLGGLAVAFCIMREWRGTINASIVAHAINNLTVLTLNVLMLRH